ncbi:hypothetical protein [Aeromonas caviae]|uniref:hypothetical protein n=1 Tax=Aeromonas caviae TaxID=648 RepID=UPI00208E8DE4|nr:hypothetical protein [Aeromonas caviae]MDX7689142.1 hypothetical protein [Aeromonas caviae]
MALNPILITRCYRGESFLHLTGWTLICATVLLTGMLTGETVHWEQVGWGGGGVLLTMVVMVLLPLHAGKRGAV